MQFMSQSMGWADNIVLAMAPLGILTAVVGAIRVGGPSWLKAIIGRARESRAISEAELMSSTSHEVCELWNGHEIVRVMGKGPIREFIVLDPAAEKHGKRGLASKGQCKSADCKDDDREMKVIQEREEHGKYLVDDSQFPYSAIFVVSRVSNYRNIQNSLLKAMTPKMVTAMATARRLLCETPMLSHPTSR